MSPQNMTCGLGKAADLANQSNGLTLRRSHRVRPGKPLHLSGARPACELEDRPK